MQDAGARPGHADAGDGGWVYVPSQPAGDPQSTPGYGLSGLSSHGRPPSRLPASPPAGGPGALDGGPGPATMSTAYTCTAAVGACSLVACCRRPRSPGRDALRAVQQGGRAGYRGLPGRDALRAGPQPATRRQQRGPAQALCKYTNGTRVPGSSPRARAGSRIDLGGPARAV
jgi:hypothetical protein